MVQEVKYGSRFRDLAILGCVFAGLGLLMLAEAYGGSNKHSVPSAAAQQEALELIKELYEKEYQQAAKERSAKATLASILLQEGKDTRDYPAGRYVLFLQARDLAAQAGDVATALQAIEEAALSFKLNAQNIFTMKVQALSQASQAKISGESYQTVINAALLLLEDAVNQDDFNSAGKLIDIAEAASIQLRSVPVLTRVRKRAAEIETLSSRFAKIKPFVETLQTSPQDGKANLEVGKYYAFFKGDWKKGLPLLAKGSDASLKRLARLDLRSPKETLKLLALADGWMDLGFKLKDVSRTHVLLRAYHWLQQAQPQLSGQHAADVVAAMDKIMAAVPPEYRIGEIVAELRRMDDHRGPVFAVAFSPNGRKFVTGSQDGTVRIWDTKSGQLIRQCEGHSGPVWAVAFSPDGRWVLSGGFDRTIRLWDPVSGRDLRRIIGHTDYIRSVAFTQDSAAILSGSDDRTVRLWKAETGEQMMKLNGHDHYVMSVALSPDGAIAASGSLDKTVRLWDLQTGKSLNVLKGHKDTVLDVAFSSDGRRVLSAGSDKTIRLWDAKTGETLHVLTGHDGYVTGVAFTPDGRRAVSCSYDRTIRLWDLQSGQEIRTLKGHTDVVWSVVFSPNGRWALSGSHDKTARLWGGAK